MPTLYRFQKNYTMDWDDDKTMFFPYTDSPELQRVAKAQEALSDVSWIVSSEKSYTIIFTSPVSFWAC